MDYHVCVLLDDSERMKAFGPSMSPFASYDQALAYLTEKKWQQEDLSTFVSASGKVCVQLVPVSDMKWLDDAVAPPS